jgi:hypothetical protein
VAAEAGSGVLSILSGIVEYDPAQDTLSQSQSSHHPRLNLNPILSFTKRRRLRRVAEYDGEGEGLLLQRELLMPRLIAKVALSHSAAEKCSNPSWGL